MTDIKKRILQIVHPDLEEIEEALQDNLSPYLDLVSETAGHILFSGGKRLRPLLMVLSARACGYEGNYDKTFSTIFEYLHAATLLHDDLVDGASLRRGREAAHTVFGAPTAVLTGDFLLARSLSIAAETRNPEIIKIIAKITEDMSQGEIHQLLNKGDITLSEATYMTVIERKTAVLIQGACRTGALVAGAPRKQEAALDTYGYNLGMAFQMADDLLDYTADTATLGKAVGADLKEGKLTLPVIYSLTEAGESDRKRMVSIIQNDVFSDREFDELLCLMKKYGGIEYTEQKAHFHVSEAKQAIEILEESQAKDILFLLADYALTRKS